VQAVLGLRPHWRLAIARTAAQALEMALRDRPDLLVVDMHLPDADGLELARRCDAEPATAAIPRVALSADATQARRLAAAEQRFRHYFTKPLDVPDFLAWLDTFARERAAA